MQEKLQENFPFLIRGTDTSDSSLTSLCTYLEYSYDVWNSGSQLVGKRQSPRKLQGCQHQGDKPAAAYLQTFLMWNEIKSLLV